MISFTAELPRAIVIDGAAYAINTDYRIMADFEMKIANADMSDRTAFAKDLFETVSALFIDVPHAGAQQIIEGVLWYYRCGNEPRETSVTPRSNNRYYDYSEDSDYIYAAFMQQYGDDLLTSKMHWWEFRAKFMALTEATEFVKIMQYRGTDVSKIKCREERSRIKKLQERYALRSQKIHRFASLEDRNEAFKEKLRKRYEEVRKKAEGK
ncbi:MAG: Gp15 family bacteriophage protein [Oscillospiraceae bacterium]|nr:Gp15 family bacteriophage protein [Oscillospiraceae bacterium]